VWKGILRIDKKKMAKELTLGSRAVVSPNKKRRREKRGASAGLPEKLSPQEKGRGGGERSGFWCCYWAGAPDGSRRLGHLGPIDQEGNKGIGRLAGQVLDASHAGGVPCSVLYGSRPRVYVSCDVPVKVFKDGVWWCQVTLLVLCAG
jgi:hypothetical protein